LAALIGPDGAAREASSRSRAACLAFAPRGRGLLAQRTGSPAGQGHIGPGQRVFPRPEDGVQQPECLDPLVVCEGARYLAPEHLFQDVEYSLDLGDVEARLEAVRRDLLG
jgi:hypothetical protein